MEISSLRAEKSWPQNLTSEAIRFWNTFSDWPLSRHIVEIERKMKAKVEHRLIQWGG